MLCVSRFCFDLICEYILKLSCCVKNVVCVCSHGELHISFCRFLIRNPAPNVDDSVPDLVRGYRGSLVLGAFLKNLLSPSSLEWHPS